MNQGRRELQLIEPPVRGDEERGCRGVKEGEVPLFMQWDKRWGYESYGDSNIGLSGCGPTCLSMVYLYFTGDVAGNPREIARYCEENGFYTPSGTSSGL